MHKVDMKDIGVLQAGLVHSIRFYKSIKDTTKNKSSNRPKTFHIAADSGKLSCGAKNMSLFSQSLPHCVQLGSVPTYIFQLFEPFLVLNFESKHTARHQKAPVQRIH